MPITHLLSTKDLSDAGLQTILRDARLFVSELGFRHDRTETLAGRNVALAFFEPSTRTRLSFETAAHRLGASTVVFQPTGSSVAKGETLAETMATINAMRFDALIVRHAENGTHQKLTEIVDAPILNAGEGTVSHPTQALLDASALLERRGTLQGAKICVVGDVRHSRVARSQVDVFRRLGAEYAVCAPDELLPTESDEDLKDCPTFANIDDALEWADVISLLRIQRERIVDVDIPSVEAYRKSFAMTIERVKDNDDVDTIHP